MTGSSSEDLAANSLKGMRGKGRKEEGGEGVGGEKGGRKDLVKVAVINSYDWAIQNLYWDQCNVLC